VTVDGAITSFLGTANFAEYEQNVYEKYQEMAEYEIIAKLNLLLASVVFLEILKRWASQCGCRYLEYREITVRLKSGRPLKVQSPVFLRAKPKKKRGRSPKRHKGALRHLGLELLGILKRISPALMEICVSMAVLCPSFEVAAGALRGLGVAMNEHLLQNITSRFAKLAKNIRVECNGDAVWQKPGIKILICVDGGRIRERCAKRGKRKKGQKRQGYSTEWFEPRLLTISQFGPDGQKIKSVSPILDGSCGSLDDFFELVKEYLVSINLDEAAEIIFCADGGKGIWPRIDMLISELGLSKAKQILDYTHAKQNISIVKKILSDALKLSDKECCKLSTQVRELLWHGSINGIASLVREKLARKKSAAKSALKKLNDYFGDHSRFQYKTFRDNGLPTGSGTVESAIRRVINLRIKGTGLFWKRENAENIIFLRSLVLTGKLKNACRKGLGIVRNMFDNNTINDLPLTA
jgi:ribosomal protein L31E